MSVVLVAAGGAVGACARYLIDAWVTRRIAPRAAQRGHLPFPLGILTVNVLASFVLGAATGLLSPVAVGMFATTPTDAGENWHLFVTVGVCGALSTYSTFAGDTAALLRAGATGRAMLNVLLNVAACVVAVVAGLVVVAVLTDTSVPADLLGAAAWPPAAERS